MMNRTQFSQYQMHSCKGQLPEAAVCYQNEGIKQRLMREDGPVIKAETVQMCGECQLISYGN